MVALAKRQGAAIAPQPDRVAAASDKAIANLIMAKLNIKTPSLLGDKPSQPAFPFLSSE